MDKTGVPQTPGDNRIERARELSELTQLGGFGTVAVDEMVSVQAFLKTVSETDSIDEKILADTELVYI